MPHRCHNLLILLLVGVVSLGTSADAEEKETAQQARDRALREADQKAFAENMVLYERDVKPFLTAHCLDCHGPKLVEGDLSLDLLDPDMKESTSAARWATVRQRLTAGEMPPAEQPQPTAAEKEKVLAWIKAEMKRSRRNFARRLQMVQGNAVPHQLLFDPDHKAEFHNPRRLRRLSHEIYETARAEQAKGFENLVSNPFTPDPRYEYADMGSPTVDVPTTGQLLRNALTIVERQTSYRIENGEMKPLPGSNREYLKLLAEESPFGDEEMTRLISLHFQKVLGRQPTAIELERFLGLMRKNVSEAGRLSGIRYSLAAIHLLPEAIFRYEVGDSSTRTKRVRLRPREIADALSYALTDRRPPNWLMEAANNGDLDTDSGVAEAARRLLADKKTEKARIPRFFHEFFEYPRSLTVFKDSDDFPHHHAKGLVADTDELIRWIVERDQDVLKELLTTNKAFVNVRRDPKTGTYEKADRFRPTHLSYNLPPDWKWTDQQPIELPPQTRAGILTQPSWLVAWSMNEDNHAILRGKWVRERLLGNVVPDIPITVDAQLPEAPEKTLRERMAVTEESYCWQCHKLMNPVGLPFEQFDHFGRWRANELGKAVDATGRIDLTGDPKIEHKVENAIEFVHRLAESERVEQVFVRQVFRYLSGRNENLGDGPSLRAAHRAYREQGGSFNALIVAILSSESFLYRTEVIASSGPNESPD